MKEKFPPQDFGYRVPGPKHDCIALYVPEFRHVWLNPHYKEPRTTTALFEEFIHAAETAFRPAELLPLLNFLAGVSTHPRHAEFRDIVEAVYYASYPLAFDTVIDPDHLPPVYSPYQALGTRVIRLACALAESRSQSPGDQEARTAALWAIVLMLLNVVPQVSGAGHRIMDLVEPFRPANRWSNARSLLNEMLIHLAQQREIHAAMHRVFRVGRPNHSHQMLFLAVDVVHAFIEAPIERVIPTLPVLLSALTLDTWRALQSLRFHRRPASFQPIFEYWPQTEDNLAACIRALRPDLDQFEQTGGQHPCLAKLAHIHVVEFLRQLHARRPYYSNVFLLHEMLELFPEILQLLMLKEEPGKAGCAICQKTFTDGAFLERIRRIVALSGYEKARLITAGAKYGAWLRSDCLRWAARMFDLPRRARLRKPLFFIQGKRETPQRRWSTYAMAYSKGEVLAQFLPALGQIWIYPNCPQKRVTMVRLHELTHQEQCGLHPSQLVHLRAFLLDRPLPNADCFEDLVEASNVLGQVLAAGGDPQVKRFPLVSRRIKRLAARMLSVARQLALAAHPSVSPVRARIEACRSVLLVLWHVVPSKAGMGFDAVEYLRRVKPPLGWKSSRELWPDLHWELTNLFKAEKPPGMGFYSAVNPHRRVSEMLMFLAQITAPIPERVRAVLASVPVWIQLLTCGSIVSVPLVRVRRTGRHYVAEIEALHTATTAEKLIQKIVAAQRDSLRQLQSRGIDCLCTRYFAEVLERTAPFRQSTNRTRMVRCLASLLDNLSLEPFLAEKFSCKHCEHNLKNPIMRNALEMLQAFLPDSRPRLLHAVRSYESWLLSEGIQILKAHSQLDAPLRVVNRFCYL